jgi:hypothetical protein
MFLGPFLSLLSTLLMETEKVFLNVTFWSALTRLIASENFSAFLRLESLKSYKRMEGRQMSTFPGGSQQMNIAKPQAVSYRH